MHTNTVKRIETYHFNSEDRSSIEKTNLIGGSSPKSTSPLSRNILAFFPSLERHVIISLFKELQGTLLVVLADLLSGLQLVHDSTKIRSDGGNKFNLLSKRVSWNSVNYEFVNCLSDFFRAES